MNFAVPIAANLALCMAGQAAPNLPTLRVGDPAPPIQVSEWIKGSPLRSYRAGDVYVIDYWSTWCSPCIAGMPHLTQIQARYAKKGVHVIGLTSLDRYGNDLGAVRRFVAANPSKMGYAVAVDAADPRAYQGVFRGKMAWSYMAAAEARGLPTIFIIDRAGKVAYIGLPDLAEDTLRQVVSGAFDLAEATARYRKICDALPRFDGFSKNLADKHFEAAFGEASELVRGPFHGDPQRLWMIADAIVSPDDPQLSPGYGIGLSAVSRAAQLSRYGNAGILATLARAYFVNQDFSDAVRVCGHAAQLAVDGQRDALLKDLAKYKASVKSAQ